MSRIWNSMCFFVSSFKEHWKAYKKVVSGVCFWAVRIIALLVRYSYWPNLSKQMSENLSGQFIVVCTQSMLVILEKLSPRPIEMELEWCRKWCIERFQISFTTGFHFAQKPTSKAAHRRRKKILSSPIGFGEYYSCQFILFRNLSVEHWTFISNPVFPALP